MSEYDYKPKMAPDLLPLQRYTISPTYPADPHHPFTIKTDEFGIWARADQALELIAAAKSPAPRQGVELIEGKCGLRKLLSELHGAKLGQYSRDLDRAIALLQTTDPAVEERDKLRAEREDWLRRMQAAESKADQLREQLAQPQTKLVEWQPIESAPRYSSRILVGYYNWENLWVVHEAWWRMPYEGAPAERCWWCYDGDSTLLSADVHSGPDGKKLGATHWQPLPAPPAQTKVTP